MSTGFKMSSLVCKYIFYRPEHDAKWDPGELNFDILEIRK